MATTTPADAVLAPTARLEPDGTRIAQDTLTAIVSAPDGSVDLTLALQGSPAPVSGHVVAVPHRAGQECGPVMPRRRLGAELRRLREARFFRLEDVASVLDVAPSTLSRIETGKAPARTSVGRIDRVYAARGITCPISVAPRSLLIRLVTARTLSIISSAVATHLNGLASAFQSAANRLIALLTALTDQWPCLKKSCAG